VGLHAQREEKEKELEREKEQGLEKEQEQGLEKEQEQEKLQGTG